MVNSNHVNRYTYILLHLTFKPRTASNNTCEYGEERFSCIGSKMSLNVSPERSSFVVTSEALVKYKCAALRHGTLEGQRLNQTATAEYSMT